MSNTYARGQHDVRPWGKWEVVDCGNDFCVKRITVNAGGILSLQLHHYRAENWVIVAGIATITLGEQQLEKHVGESVYIPVETKHRIRNDGAEPLVFIEVQTGQTLDENDIVRFEDKYGRIG